MQASVNIVHSDPRVEADYKDKEILAARYASFAAHVTPQTGDYVRFADGSLERISHDWGDGYQTSPSGSWYLGDGFVSFSGGLNPLIPASTMSLSDEKGTAEFWFFHHDYWTAHNAVYVQIPVRVWKTTRQPYK